jgi:hypothetical protein
MYEKTQEAQKEVTDEPEIEKGDSDKKGPIEGEFEEK